MRSHDRLIRLRESPQSETLVSFPPMSTRSLARNLARTSGSACHGLSASSIKRATTPLCLQLRSTSSKPNYDGHIPLNWLETGLLTAGSAFMAITNPRRGGGLCMFCESSRGLIRPVDMVAALGETTAGPTVSWLRERMLASAEGRQILKERPRVNSSTVDMDTLAQLPDGTLGKAYVTWLERCGVTPDTREPVSLPF